VESLRAYCNHPRNKSTGKGWPRKQVDSDMEEATGAAISALLNFRAAEGMHKAQLTNQANSIVEKAMASLKYRYGIPTFSSIVSNHL